MRANPERRDGFSEYARACQCAVDNLRTRAGFIHSDGRREVISNFLLWQLAYTELYFTDALWSDLLRLRLTMRLRPS